MQKAFFESAEIIKKSAGLSTSIEEAIIVICDCVRNGHRIYLFGNGGSAADAQHVAAEFIGRYKTERKSIPAISLTTDTSILTSVANDYSFNEIFSRQCEGLVNQDDVIIAISTSGNSKNVINGLISAKKKGAKTIGLLGNKGGSMANLVDIPLIVDSCSTARIQEAHRIIYHIICELVEKELSTN
ncbi:MAG: D-sedoheptulose 7-phosphate isomerase [Thaumarchaeota archaeon]|nr:D-sedoheptulose 7-phosphate isomerase [Nitrososphaerota archaeon]